MSRDNLKYEPPILCISCGKPLSEIPDSENFEMVDSAVVGTLEAGYGSIHDGSTLQIGICDDCLGRHLTARRVKVVKSVFGN
ncbi:MAG: hypothetical protein GF334_07510 [Candidatus Altiarchaeales archaeon]|nr:hypothetical protein [Candidatus Altiarchaeales archaeon]